MVPDYISEKKMLELKVDKNGDGHCYTCMGCRSFLTPYVDENGKPKYYGRFNQGVVTVNLIDIALLRAQARAVGISDIRQKGSDMLFTLHQLNFDAVGQLCNDPDYMQRVTFVATAKQPTLRLKLSSGVDSLKQSKIFIARFSQYL